MNICVDLTDGFFIDEWWVEPKLGRLTKDGEFHQIEPKIMRVLVFLAKNQGKVVRKEEFLKDIWEGVNVTPHVLTRTIAEIRRVFGDDPQNPRFIQTIPTIGYRLIAGISEARYQEAQFTPREGSAAMPFHYAAIRRRPTKLIYFASGVLTVIAVFAMLLILLSRSHVDGNFHY